MKNKKEKIMVIMLAAIILGLLAGTICVLISIMKSEKITTIEQGEETIMSTLKSEEKFGEATILVMPEVVGTWYEDEMSKEKYIEITNAEGENLVGSIQWTEDLFLDFTAKKVQEGKYEFSESFKDFSIEVSGTVEIKEKSIEVKINLIENKNEELKKYVTKLENNKILVLNVKESKINSTFEAMTNVTANLVMNVSTGYDATQEQSPWTKFGDCSNVEDINILIDLLKKYKDTTYLTEEDISVILQNKPYSLIFISNETTSINVWVPDSIENPIVIESENSLSKFIIDVKNNEKNLESIKNLINGLIIEEETNLKAVEEVRIRIQEATKKSSINNKTKVIPQTKMVSEPVAQTSGTSNVSTISSENNNQDPQNIVRLGIPWNVKVIYNSDGSIVFKDYEADMSSQYVEKSVDGYEIFRSTSKDGTYEKVTTSVSTECTITGIDRSIPYYYKARAYKSINGVTYYGSFGNSQYVPAEITQSPKNIFFTTDYDFYMKVSFNSLEGANAYYVEKSSTKDGKYEYQNWGNSTTIRALVWGNNAEYYKVYAANIAGNTQYEIYGPKSDAIYIPACLIEKPTLKVITTQTYYPNQYPQRTAYDHKTFINPISGADGYLLKYKSPDNPNMHIEPIDVKAVDCASFESDWGYNIIQAYKKGNNYLLYGLQSSNFSGSETKYKTDMSY